MAKYKKRADGRYSTSVIIGYTEDGTARRKILYGRTIAELDNNVAEFKSLKNKGIIIDDKNLTVAQWAEKWLELYKKDKAYNTYACYQRTIDAHIIPNLGDIRLGALKQNHVQKLLNDIIQDGHMRTAELVRLTLQQMIHQALIEEYIYKDITVGLSLPQKQQPKKRSLTDAEKKLIQAADFNPKERAFVDLLYYTGVRRGEALALTRDDIDFVNKTISINKNLVMKSNTSEIKPSPKTKAGIRELPIPEKLMKTLIDYVYSLGGKYLFSKNDGDLMTNSSFRRFWDNILDKINIAAGGTKYTRKDMQKKDEKVIQLIANDITPHTFRHTYATSLYYSGVDIKSAQYLLGHSSIQMTLDVYTHLDNEKITDSRAKLDAFFK